MFLIKTGYMCKFISLTSLHIYLAIGQHDFFSLSLIYFFPIHSKFMPINTVNVIIPIKLYIQTPGGRCGCIGRRSSKELIGLVAERSEALSPCQTRARWRVAPPSELLQGSGGAAPSRVQGWNPCQGVRGAEPPGKIFTKKGYLQ